MEIIPIKFSVEQILTLSRQLPKELKLLLIQEWNKELESPNEHSNVPNLNIEGFDEPFDLDKAKLSPEKLDPLQKLWEDELSAEELVKML